MKVRITKENGLYLGQVPVLMMPPPYNPQAYVMDDNREILLKLKDWMVAKQQRMMAGLATAKMAMRRPATRTVAGVVNQPAMRNRLFRKLK